MSLNQSSAPILSVIMSVYNQAEYLSSSIESILKQSFRDFEFIIINDGSSDESQEILESYAKKDSRIKVFSQGNKGLTKSLNIALDYAEGRYIARQDADDLSHPKRFERQLEFFKENSEHVLLSTAFEEIDLAGKVVIEKFPKQNFCDQKIRKKISCFNPIAHSSAMFKAFDARGKVYYDESYRYSQDYALWVYLLNFSGNKAAILSDLLLQKRQGLKMISVKKRREQLYFSIRAKLQAWKLGLMNPKYYLLLLKDCLVYSLFKKSPREIFSFMKSS